MVSLTRNRNPNDIYNPFPTRPTDHANHQAAPAANLTTISHLQSIKGDSHTVVRRSDLRRRVRVRSANERLLQCRRLPPKLPNDVFGTGRIGFLWRPVVARGSVQHVRGTRRALPRVTRTALRGGVEECAGGYVRIVVDVCTEALGCPVRHGRERGAPVASLLQAYITPGGTIHVQFHPCGRQVLTALHGASPAVFEGDPLSGAAVDCERCQHGPAVVGVVGPEGEGLCGAAVGEQDADAVAARGSGLEEGFERARDPRAGAFGLGWGGEDGGNGGGESKAKGKD